MMSTWKHFCVYKEQ